MKVSKEKLRHFYSTVGQRTQHKSYKTSEVEKYHILEETFLRSFLKPGKRVLEIGVGLGRIVDALLDWAGEIVGIDYVPEVVEAAKNKYSKFESIRIVELDICKDFNDNVRDLGKFDYVLCMFNTFGTFLKEERSVAIDNMYSFLKRGGVDSFSLQ